MFPAPKSAIVSILLSGMVLATAADQAPAQFVFARVAATGDPAPDRPGASFGLFNGLALGNEGTLALVGETAFNYGGIWVTRPEGLRELTKSSIEEQIFVRDDGKIVRVNPTEIVVYEDGAELPIVRTGQSVPGLPGATFSAFYDVVFQPNGCLLFVAFHSGLPSSYAALWAYRGGQLERLFLQGEKVPDMPQLLYRAASDWVTAPAISEDGSVVFTTWIGGPGRYDPQMRAMFTDRDGVVRLLFLQGDPVPVAGGGESFVAFKNPHFLEDHRIAFAGVLTGGASEPPRPLALFRETDSAPPQGAGWEIFAQIGGPAANQPAGHLYSGLRNFTFSDEHTSFVGISNDTFDPGQGVQRVWVGPPDELVDILSARWLKDRFAFDPPWEEGEFLVIVRVTANRLGRLVIHTANVVDDEPREALWLTGAAQRGGTRLWRIVGVGDPLDGRTVDRLMRYAFNDRSELALHVRFDDETEGVYRVSLAADFDGDGDVDESDFRRLLSCLSEGGEAPAGRLTTDSAECAASDLDGDGDVDLADFEILSRSFTGSV